MNRYDEMFEALSAKKEKAFVPFTVIGDPTIEDSVDIIAALVEGGADALELGIPFSDPVADGPTIQAAGVRALNAGATPPACFEVIRRVRDIYPKIPIGLLIYANLVISKGMEAFYKACRASGVDSVLVADLPVFEADVFIKAALDNDICPVFIAPPNASDETYRKIAALTKGYTYVVARSGVTGCDEQVDVSHKSIFGKLKSMNAPPTMLGFGISTPEHVKVGLAAGADGVISGSAVVSRVEKGESDMPALLSELKAFVAAMKAATR
jgi:tryptophan synthase alpha chain